jgi:hypothetical protein
VAVLALLTAVTAGAAACSGSAPPPHPQGHVVLTPRTRAPSSGTSVLTGPVDVVAMDLAHSLFVSAPVVVVANPSSPDLAAAAADALRAHAPLLLTSPGAPSTGGRTGFRTAAGSRADAGLALRAQIMALDPRDVLAMGVAGSVLAPGLPGVHVVTDPAMLPATGAPAALGHVAVLVPSGTGTEDAATVAAATTARVAGVRVITVRGGDPRADPAASAALAAARPRQVLAIGSPFGSAALLAARITVARTGIQLPGGGQVMFPGRMLVALYGHPGAPGLGVLGHQDLPASIARAIRTAAAYRSLSKVPVIPAFEIIATVAEGHPGPDGSYSYQTPVSMLRPWVRRATAAGMYVILDLQPGRASLLAQAKAYQSLLEMPDVGLALDAEWKLQPGQVPLHQIGSVSVTEVNSVVGWLAALTARYRLPQKLLVLHQFRLSMIRGERGLDTGHDDLAILIHMDGQGTPRAKLKTWTAVTRAAPPGVFFGWKDFYLQDHPMLTPRQTVTRTPRLSMVSYQ